MDKPHPRHQHLKAKIAVSGAAETAHCGGQEALDIALAVGAEVVRQGAILVTGATTGFPLWAAKGAKEAGGMVIGMSPAASEAEHVELYRLPLDYADMIVYTGFGYSGRNLLLTRASDAVVVGCGRIGTVNEFTVAFEDGKPLGVLEGNWLTDEILKKMVDASHRSNEKLVYDKEPASLIRRILELVGRDRKESYGIYANSDGLYEECERPECKIIL